MTAPSKVTAQGQISVPAEIRKKLGIGPGSILEWETQDGQAVVRKAGRSSFADVHRALFPEKPAKRNLANVKDAIGKYIRSRHARG
ncbi:MAG: AbrB/MazE/SpoVT family DNA-binding domain-containing protein [Alphaproteobacteria bacterium]|nr:AbrB/MazE/SpoVT family DNA-binding domain-containing protein [Alphaproteobacteria bacterium]